MEELKVFDIVKHFKYETLTEEQKKPVCILTVLYRWMPYIRKPANIWSSTKHCMMAVLMGSMLSLIRYCQTSRDVLFRSGSRKIPKYQTEIQI